MDITKTHALPSALLCLGGLTASAAVAAASAVFFQQVSEDLAANLKHAGRKVIQDSDVIQLLRRYAPHSTLFVFMNKYLQCSRQRQLTSHTTVFSLAQRYLPIELLQEISMPVSKVQPHRRQGQRPSLQAVGWFLNHSRPATQGATTHQRKDSFDLRRNHLNRPMI